MEVVAFTDPVAFRERVSPFLLTDEARHNLLLGIAGALVERPEVYPAFHLWLVEDAARSVVGAATLTPPFNLVIARPAVEDVPVELAKEVHAEGVRPPGVSGAEPEAQAFADAWCALTGATATRRMAQRIYRLTEVRPVPPIPGAMREATAADRGLLLAWMVTFAGEALVDREGETERIERLLDARLVSNETGYFLWEDQGVPVCLVGTGGPTPNGVRIGPVYTSPAFRGRGYASALTAAVSALSLQRGRRFCFLYTDLANPTSNAIYQRIGYEPVCDASDVRFEPASG